MERLFALGLIETEGAVWDPQYLKPLFSRTLREEHYKNFWAQVMLAISIN